MPVFELEEGEVVHEDDFEPLADRVEDELDSVARQVDDEVDRERLLVAAGGRGKTRAGFPKNINTVLLFCTLKF